MSQPQPQWVSKPYPQPVNKINVNFIHIQCSYGTLRLETHTQIVCQWKQRFTRKYFNIYVKTTLYKHIVSTLTTTIKEVVFNHMQSYIKNSSY